MMSVTFNARPLFRVTSLTVFAALLLLGLSACGQKDQAAGPAAATDAAAPDAETGATETEGGMEGMAGGAGMEGMDHDAMDHDAMDHSAMGHDMMTPEQFTELREKIPLYAVFTDEQIMANMNRMPPDWWEVLSSDGIDGNVGVLALGHGYSMGGNEQFKEKVAPIASEYPTAVAPGMAMMSGSHIQKALDALTNDFGVKTIVVLPLEPGDATSLIHQWQYIFGLRDEAPYLSVPQVKTSAKVIFTKSPVANPLIATIMGDYGLETAKNPATARLILVSHGPERVEDNPAELEQLREHAVRIVANTDFTDVQVLSLQDDAVPEVRAANKETLRRMVKEASDEGREVVIVPMILTRGGFHARLKKDLSGLGFEFADRGLIEHPAFQQWIRDSVKNAAG